MTLTIELPEDVAEAVEAQAKAQGLTAEGWVHRIVQENVLPVKEDDRPVSEMIGEIWSDMPDGVRAKLPEDGASQVDHYVYGLPKRDQ